MHTYYAANSTADNANFVHQLAYIWLNPFEVMNTIEGPRPGIDPGTSSPQGKHTKHYTNGNKQAVGVEAVWWL